MKRIVIVSSTVLSDSTFIKTDNFSYFINIFFLSNCYTVVILIFIPNLIRMDDYPVFIHYIYDRF